MVTVELHDVRIFAYHGVYEEEQNVGNNFQVFLSVTYNDEDVSFDSIISTINYEELFRIEQHRMTIKTPLLEKVCDGIIRHIKHQYPFISEVKLSVYKLQAPIEKLDGKVGVTMTRKF